MEEVYQEYQEQAQFFLVYIREAHPADGWSMPSNERQGIVYNEPVDEEERGEVASACVLDLELSMPALVDDMDNTTESAYDSHPARLYIVGTDGKLAYAGGVGPRYLDPDEMASALAELVGDEE